VNVSEQQRDSKEPVKVTSLDEQIGFQLGRVHRLVRTVWERILSDLGLTAPQAAVLRTLSQGSSTGIRELSRRLDMDPMNAKRIVDLLEERGLLQSRSDSAHRQRRVVEATAEGKALAEVIAARAASWDAELVAMVGADEAASLRALLGALEQRVRSRAETTEAGEAPQ
jgi:DNA-binding MarR family transcriptional regulator